MTEATDTNDPQVAVERRWGNAIAQWQLGKPEPLCDLFAAMPVPEFAREFLADMARGQVARPMGRRQRLPAAEEREVFFEVMRELDRMEDQGARRSALRPHDRAVAAVAKSRGWSPDRVRGVVDKARNQGLHRTIWQRWLRTADTPPKR